MGQVIVKFYCNMTTRNICISRIIFDNYFIYNVKERCFYGCKN